MKNATYPEIHHGTAKAISDIQRVVRKSTGFHMRAGMSMDKALIEIARALRTMEMEMKYIYSEYDEKQFKFLERYMPYTSKSQENTND